MQGWGDGRNINKTNWTEKREKKENNLFVTLNLQKFISTDLNAFDFWF